MSPGQQFGEAFNSEAAIAEMDPKFTQTESGLYVPNKLAEQRQQQTQAESGDTAQVGEVASDAPQPTAEVQEGGVPTATPEDASVGETIEEMDTNIEQGVEELDGLGVTQAKTEDEAIDMMAQMAAEQGADADEAKKRGRQLLDKMAAIAGITFTEFQAANQGSDLKTFLDIFFVGTEGRFGGASASSLRESLGKDNDDAYLNEELTKGGAKTLTEFFREVLEKPNLQNLDGVKDLVKEFNIKAEMSWDDTHAKMASFLNESKGQYKDRSFSKIKAVFSRLEGMSSEKILEYFNVSTATEGEATAESGTQAQGGETGAPEAGAQNQAETATVDQTPAPTENQAELAA